MLLELVLDKLNAGLNDNDFNPIKSALNDLEDYIAMVKQPKYISGQIVTAMNDICEWRCGTVAKIIAEYKYTLAMPPEGYFKGGEVEGVWWEEKNIKTY